MDDNDLDSMMKEERGTELSMFISIYAMYPVVVVEMIIAKLSQSSTSTVLYWAEA